MLSVLSIKEAIICLRRGEIIAYPTEAVYGLGCDPMNQQALKKLLLLKQRAADKGLIVVGADYSHIAPYVAMTQEELPEIINNSWPGPYNWVLPAPSSSSNLLTGQYVTQAVRVSAHPVVKELCVGFGGGIVSTSANITNQASCTTQEELQDSFFSGVAGIVSGDIGEELQPCSIRQYNSTKVIR